MLDIESLDEQVSEENDHGEKRGETNGHDTKDYNFVKVQASALGPAKLEML